MTKVITLYSKGYISTREASNKYKYCLKHIRYWLKRRKVKGFKHAGKWYVFKTMDR